MIIDDLLEIAEKGAKARGTPFISYFTPDAMLTLARAAGFAEVRHVSAASLGDLYFGGRKDGMRPPNNTEELLVATLHAPGASTRLILLDAQGRELTRSDGASATDRDDLMNHGCWFCPGRIEDGGARILSSLFPTTPWSATPRAGRSATGPSSSRTSGRTSSRTRRS